MPDPDDHRAGERIDDGFATDAHLDAAIRELDRLRRPEGWSSISGDASSGLGHAAPAGMDEPAEGPEPAYLAAPRTPSSAEDIGMGSGETVDLDDDDADLFEPEPAPAVQPTLAEPDWPDPSFGEFGSPPAAEFGYDEDHGLDPEGFAAAPESEWATGEEIPDNLSDFDVADEEELDDGNRSVEGRLPPASNLSWPSAEDAGLDAEPSSLPRRIFSLKRALDAHRLRAPVDAFPGETDLFVPRAPEPDMEQTVEPLPDLPEPTMEHIAEPVTAPMAEPVVERSAPSHPLPETEIIAPEPATEIDEERAAWLNAWRAAPSTKSGGEFAESGMPRGSVPVAPEPTHVPDSGTQAEGRSWFAVRRSADPEIEMKRADQTSEAVAMASAAAVAAGSAATAAGTRRRGWFGARQTGDAAATAPEPESSPKRARKGWFETSSRSAGEAEESARAEPESVASEPETAEPAWARSAIATPKPAAPEAPARYDRSRADPFAAMKDAIAPKPKRERKGWFRSKPARDAEAAQPSIPDQVALDGPRDFTQPAALEQAEVSTGNITSLAAATDVSTEMPTVRSADVARVGILLVNLGTPEAPTPRAVRRYLREFLSDRRVIEKDTFVWQLVFKSIILPFRPRSKARAYKSIWNQEKNESPLKTVTRAQAEKLGAALAEAGTDTVVDWAMRYGDPSIGSRIKALLAQACERILVVPLYPQYSSATTATVCDETFRVVSRLRNQPTLRIAPPYYADPAYIEAVASSIRAELARLSFEPEVIVASYHGMPIEYVQKGDPYLRQCTRTTELLRERLGKSHSQVLMTFQSRFGRAEWLQPYTDQTLRKLAKDGVRSVAVVTPGFAADCLETLEEIAIENAHVFKKKGGKNFAFVPCLNDSERGMLVIREIVARELNGWV